MSELLGMSSNSITTVCEHLGGGDNTACFYPFAPPDETVAHHIQLLLHLITQKHHAMRSQIMYVPKFTTYDFGPLGPFRGRDRPRSVLVSVQDLMDVLLSNNNDDDAQYNYYNWDDCSRGSQYSSNNLDVACANTIADFNHHQAAMVDDVKKKVGWAFAVHAGAMQARPMNVAAPRVTFMWIMYSNK